MRRALIKPDADHIEAEREQFARILKAVNEPEHFEPEEKRAPEGAVVAYVIIFAAIVFIALAATFTEWL